MAHATGAYRNCIQGSSDEAPGLRAGGEGGGEDGGEGSGFGLSVSGASAASSARAVGPSARSAADPGTRVANAGSEQRHCERLRCSDQRSSVESAPFCSTRDLRWPLADAKNSRRPRLEARDPAGGCKRVVAVHSGTICVLCCCGQCSEGVLSG